MTLLLVVRSLWHQVYFKNFWIANFFTYIVGMIFLIRLNKTLSILILVLYICWLLTLFMFKHHKLLRAGLWLYTNQFLENQHVFLSSNMPLSCLTLSGPESVSEAPKLYINIVWMFQALLGIAVKFCLIKLSKLFNNMILI